MAFLKSQLNIVIMKYKTKVQKEIWKSVKGFEGIYEISNLGRVKSLERPIWIKHINSWGVKKERILKAGVNSNGYLIVVLYKNFKAHSKKVASLVAVSFLNHEPNGLKIVVDHINNIKTDNRLENLQLITNRENASKDRFRKDYSSKYIGVMWSNQKNKWVSQITIKGKCMRIGTFDNEYKASLSYKNVLKIINNI